MSKPPLLLALVAVALAPLASPGPAGAHSWYSELVSPVTRGSCCGERDCEPVRSRYRDGVLELWANGLWTPAPPEALLGVASPDSGVHACWANRKRGVRPRFICVIVGGDA